MPMTSSNISQVPEELNVLNMLEISVRAEFSPAYCSVLTIILLQEVAASPMLSTLDSQPLPRNIPHPREN